MVTVVVHVVGGVGGNGGTQHVPEMRECHDNYFQLEWMGEVTWM